MATINNTKCPTFNNVCLNHENTTVYGVKVVCFYRGTTNGGLANIFSSGRTVRFTLKGINGTATASVTSNTSNTSVTIGSDEISLGSWFEIGWDFVSSAAILNNVKIIGASISNANNTIPFYQIWGSGSATSDAVKNPHGVLCYFPAKTNQISYVGSTITLNLYFTEA